MTAGAGAAPEGVGGTPAAELERSAAGRRVGELAARDGLFQFHFEHRVHLGWPEDWVPAHQPEHADPPEWSEGQLPERKYASFRHDLAIGSFHPSHRGKWSVHELCHGLVGFAWHPAATPFFHAAAGRLAELLPVALWYWLDEADRRRCPLHDGGGALFRAYCRECDGVQGRGQLDPAVVDEGRAFLEAELVALARTVSSGAVVPHRFATLDLSSDGLAYAAAHGARLASPGFARWIERFAVRGGGWSDSLPQLEERVRSVAGALLGGSEPEPLAPSPAHGRWRWILQDVAWRIEVVRSQCSDDVAAELDAVLDALAEATPATVDPARDPEREVGEALDRAAEEYAALDARVELLPPSELWALGYGWRGDRAGLAGTRSQLADGVRSACPASFALVGVRGGELIDELVARDRAAPRRELLPDRWAQTLEASLGPADPRAQVARYEAAILVGPLRTQAPLAGPARDGLYRLAPGARVEEFSVRVAAISAAVAAGRMPPQEGTFVTVVVTRTPSGEPVVAEIEASVAAMLRALGEGGELPLTPAMIAELQSLGAIVPARYAI